MYQVVFDNKGDRRNLCAIFNNHMNTINAFWSVIYEAYWKPYDYLVFNNNPKNPDNLRVRMGIFPDKVTYVYDL